MARMRMIKPEFWDDEKLATISRDARLTFIGMWNNSDDYGVVKGHHAWLKNNIFPYDDIKTSEFQKWLLELERIQVIFQFEVNSEKYYYIKNFQKHQTINRPSQIKNPTPPGGINKGSMSTHGVLTAEVKLSKREVKLKEIKLNTPVCERPTNFEQFWKIYPKKKSQGQAEKAFLKLNPDEQLLAVILEAVGRATKSEDWVKEKGRFIPHPATWINAKGWLDQEPESHPLAGMVSDKTIRTVQMLDEWRPPA